MVKKRTIIFFAAVYYPVCLFIYAGFLFHRSLSPWIFCYSKSYFIFLAAAASIFLLPTLLWTFSMRFGCTGLLHFTANGAAFLFFLYFIFSLHYYYNQEHLFDPFLQNPISPPEGAQRNKPGNTFRVICLGDSATKNVGLAEESRYTRIVEAALKKRYPSINIEVIDGSATWYTTKHSLISYATYYEDWDADLVILMHGINDLVRSFSPQASAIGEYNELWTHFYGPAMKGARPPTFEKHIMEYFDTPINAWYAGFRFREIDYPPERYVSLPVFKNNLAKLIRYIRNNGSVVMLVTQPSLYKESMPGEELRRLYFGRTVASTRVNFLQSEYPSYRSFYQAMELFNEAARGVARKEGVICVDAAGSVEKNLRNFHDDIHYTAEGAGALAEKIAEAIIAEKIVRPSGNVSDKLK